MADKKGQLTQAGDPTAPTFGSAFPGLAEKFKLQLEGKGRAAPEPAPKLVTPPEAKLERVDNLDTVTAELRRLGERIREQTDTAADYHELAKLRERIDSLSADDAQRALGRLNDVWDLYKNVGEAQVMGVRLERVGSDIDTRLEALAKNRKLWKKPTGAVGRDVWDRRKTLMTDYLRYPYEARLPLAAVVGDNTAFKPAIDDLMSLFDVREYMEGVFNRKERYERLLELMHAELYSLRDDADLWLKLGQARVVPGPAQRQDLVLSYVVDLKDNGRNIGGFLSPATRKQVFERMNRLRQQNAERISLDEQAQAVQEQGTYVSDVEPPMPTNPALAEVTHAAKGKDEQRRAERGEDIDQLAPGTFADPSGEHRSSEDEPVLNDEVVPSGPPPVFDLRRVSEPTHADYLLRKYEIPGGTPKVVGQWNELLDEVQAMVNAGLTTADEVNLARDKLVEVLTVLDQESQRVGTAFRLHRLPKSEKVRLETYVRDGRRRRQLLLRRLRVTATEKVEVGTELGPGQVIREQLDLVRLELLRGHRLLSAEVLETTALNDLLGNVETKISQISKAIEDERVAGSNVVLLDALEQANRKDLRRLQEQAKRAIAELKTFDLSPGYEPEDLHDLVDGSAWLEMLDEEPDGTLSENHDHEQDVAAFAADTPEPVVSLNAASESARVAQPVIDRGTFNRVRDTWSNAINYIRSGWRRVYSEEILGELSPHELDRSVEVSATEKRLQAVAGVAGGLASALGAAFVPDLVRWSTQTQAARFDREDLRRAIVEAIRTRQDLYGSDKAHPRAALDRYERMLSAHRERQLELLDKVKTHRRLTPEHKAALLVKLSAVLNRFEAGEAVLQTNYHGEIENGLNTALETLQDEADAIIDTHMVSKVSGGKVVREAVNSAIVAGSAAVALTGVGTLFAGLHFARGPAYSLQVLAERYRKASQEKARGERRSEVTYTSVVKEGFHEWWSKLQPSGSVQDKRQALGTLSRTLGLGSATLAAGGVLVAETAQVLDLEGALERAFESVKNYAGEQYDKWFPEAPPVAIPQPITPPDDIEVTPVEGGITFRGEIPAGSRVIGGTEHEGITRVLGRVIKLNPEAYGFEGDSDVSADLFAKRLAIKVAEADGQMRRWLTDKAIDKLNLFPEFTSGEWHITAVIEGKKFSMAELAEYGYTSSAPVSQ